MHVTPRHRSHQAPKPPGTETVRCRNPQALTRALGRYEFRYFDWVSLMNSQPGLYCYTATTGWPMYTTCMFHCTLVNNMQEGRIDARAVNSSTA